jgi:hypothetical protein
MPPHSEPNIPPPPRAASGPRDASSDRGHVRDSRPARRPILPRPRALSVTAESPSPSPTRRLTRTQRTNVTIACDGCKIKRTRCDGQKPCSRCLEKATTCSYDQGIDRRRQRPSGCESQILAQRLDQYHRFVQLLRTTSPATAFQLLGCLRSCSEEISRQLDSTDDAALLQALRFADWMESNQSTSDPLQPVDPMLMDMSKPARSPDTPSSQPSGDIRTYQSNVEPLSKGAMRGLPGPEVVAVSSTAA